MEEETTCASEGRAQVFDVELGYIIDCAYERKIWIPNQALSRQRAPRNMGATFMKKILQAMVYYSADLKKSKGAALALSVAIISCRCCAVIAAHLWSRWLLIMPLLVRIALS